MKKFKIIDNKEDPFYGTDRIVVKASVSKRKLASDPLETIELGDVLVFLRDQGIDVGNYTSEQDLVLGNNADNLSLSGEFIFVSTKVLTPAPKVDKVVVEEKEFAAESKPASATTKSTTSSRRRRRTRASTTKKEDQLLGTETLE
tara:strand:- start:93 stop:527 length:435 start_codon:yes stop_codon:yes gene_type:complete